MIFLISGNLSDSLLFLFVKISRTQVPNFIGYLFVFRFHNFSKFVSKILTRFDYNFFCFLCLI